MTMRGLGRVWLVTGVAIAMLAAMFVLAASVDDVGAQGPGTIADIAIANPDLSTLVDALTAATDAGAFDFLGTVSDPDQDLTVFAPTNDAFDALGSTLTLALEDPGGLLTSVLAYHVLGSSQGGAELVAAGSATTLQGTDVTIEVRGGNVFINDSMVTIADIEASNGVVHVIDMVLLPNDDPPPPAAQTIAEIATANPDLTTLVTAMTLARDGGGFDFIGAASDPNQDLTVFAPTNGAFAALGDTVEEALADPAGLLTTLLSYHVLGSSETGAELVAAASATTLQGEDITVEVRNGDVFINNSQVLTADIEASNGIIHVINGVLLPPSITDPVAPGACLTREFTSIDAFLPCVSAQDATVHLDALQSFADDNGGNRQSGMPGYDASADYVANLLEAAGLSVERQEFDFAVYSEESSSLSVDGVGVETMTMSFSGSGSIADGNIVNVDLDLGLNNASSSGCESEDFDGLDFSGGADVALMQRGGCAFSAKVNNAAAAGAEAVIIFNQGDTADRVGLIDATLGDAFALSDLPVLDVGYADGVTISEASSVSLSAVTSVVTSTTENILADLPGVNPDNVVMAGAHLDSVAEGPGIQDNGSGTSALLTTALALANNETYVPQNTLRFAFWGAEEAGLVGSEKYVFDPEFGLTDEEYAAIAAYLNFDMIASPNFIFGVLDADESSFDASVPVPAGSAALEDLFEAYYSDNGIPYDDAEFSGRSDYQAFVDVDIPASGLFTGADGIKTDRQATIWGGTAGDPFDPCYHQACDTIDNVSQEALNVNINAVAYALLHLAASTETVNGVAGIELEGRTAADVIIVGPEGSFGPTPPPPAPTPEPPVPTPTPDIPPPPVPTPTVDVPPPPTPAPTPTVDVPPPPPAPTPDATPPPAPTPDAPSGPGDAIDVDQRPFKTHSVPGRVEAERFDNGGEGIAYSDAEPANRGNSTVRADEGVDVFNPVNSGASSPIIGSTRGGEWTEYTVFVPEAGEYELVARVSSGFSDPGFIRARVNNTPVGTVDGDTGGWYNWRERSFGNANFQQGENVVRLAWNGGGQVNLDWFEINPAFEGLPSIAEIAVNDDRFSTLVTALALASEEGSIDFLAAVADEKADLTVFAPTNDAFEALGDTLGAALADPGGLLTQVLSYHVLGSSEYAAELVADKSANTLAGSSVRISVRPGGVFINDAKVLISNVPAKNGIVHVIDAVLLPPPAAECRGLAQEAEDGVVSGNFVVQSPAPSASGGAYVEAPQGSGFFDGDDFVEFCVTIEEAGVYRIDVQARAFDSDDDSFFVSVDGGPKALFDTAIDDHWFADTVSARGIAPTVRYQLDAGAHTVRFYQRDAGTQLDSIELVLTGGTPTNLR